MGLNVVYPENTMVWKSIHEKNQPADIPSMPSKDFRYFRQRRLVPWNSYIGLSKNSDFGWKQTKIEIHLEASESI